MRNYKNQDYKLNVFKYYLDNETSYKNIYDLLKN